VVVIEEHADHRDPAAGLQGFTSSLSAAITHSRSSIPVFCREVDRLKPHLAGLVQSLGDELDDTRPSPGAGGGEPGHETDRAGAEDHEVVSSGHLSEFGGIESLLKAR